MKLVFVIKENNNVVESKEYPEWQNTVPEKGSTILFCKPDLFTCIVSSIEWIELPFIEGRYYFKVLVICHKLNEL